MDVSVVIPTRNRVESLTRLLGSLGSQTHPLREVLIVDASDSPLQFPPLRAQFPRLNIRLLHSKPSACVQRNLGIRAAASEYIFLCDDDIEVPPDYVDLLAEHFRGNPDVGAASGLVMEPGNDGVFNDGFHRISLASLLSNFVFQHTVWADLSTLRSDLPVSLILSCLRRFYKWRGNAFTLAGWPLLTQVQNPVFRTAIYGLGGSIIRREWLLRSPYDEILEEHGIGDNYGVALGFPGAQPIGVLMHAPVFHHKVHDNRLPAHESYLRRVLALHYFMMKSPRFSGVNRALLLWSLVGHLLGSMRHKDAMMLRSCTRAILLLASGRNPYVLRWKEHDATAGRVS